MTIHFHKASLKLTSLYLAIIMVIGLFFSFNIYQLSVSEFDRGIRGGVISFEGVPSTFAGPLRNQIIEQRDTQYQDAKQRIVRRLVFINLGILISGGILSYYLARWTLRPIEEAHASLERFTADASHELRTPIAAMRAETEVALMNPKLKPAEIKELLTSNLEELDKLTSLSEGLLRLAQTKNGSLKHSKVLIEDLLAAAVARVSKQAEQKNILIHTKSTRKVSVSGDSSALTE